MSSSEFRMREARGLRAASTRNAAARKTRDHAITILQGRCVGGSTTVNWTVELPHPGRAPSPIGAIRLGLRTMDEAALAPWFERWRSASRIAPWTVAPNAQQRRRCGAAARSSAFPTGAIRAQREGLLEPRLLRHGLSHQRQAVDARHHDSRGPRAGRHARAPRARVERLVIERDRVVACEAHGIGGQRRRGLRASRAPARAPFRA